MGKTIINIAITMTDDEWDRFDKRFDTGEYNALNLIEDAISDTLINEFGIVNKTKVIKIE